MYNKNYKSDAGSSIVSSWRSKTTDFTEQYPDLINQFYTVYGARLIYVDKIADTPVTLYYSTDGGVTWTPVGTNTVGTGNGATKSTEFYFIETSNFWDFKIESGSTDKEFQWVALELDFMPRGAYKEIS